MMSEYDEFESLEDFMDAMEFEEDPELYDGMDPYDG